MPDPSTYRPEPGSIPTQPGVYRFRDPHGVVIYVGKAKNLRARLSSYFQDIGGLHQRTATMVTTAAGVDWTVVNTEVEALQLEYSWIKEYDPRFNVKYRDDKSYPWLAVTYGDEFPRVMVGRGAKRRGTRYYGPYSHAWAIRETVDLLLRVFPMRSCSNGVFKRSSQIGRPCLLGYIGKCSAPCVGRVTEQEHRAIVDDFCDFMAGNTSAFVKRVERQMYDASAPAGLREGGPAARRPRRPQPGAGEAAGGARRRHRRRRARAVPRTRSRSPCRSSTCATAGSRASAAGWPTASRTSTPARWSASSCSSCYAGESSDAIPREILVPALPDDAATSRSCSPSRAAARCRSGCRSAATSGRSRRRSPRNAEQSLALHKTKRASDLTTRNRALEEIQRGARAADGAAADRVLRHLQPAGHRGGGLDGGVRGRAGPQERVPPVRDPRGRRPERRRVDARGDHPAVPAAARRAHRDAGSRRRAGRRERRPERPDAGRPRHRPAAQVRLRARPGGRRRRSAPGGRGAAGARRARHRRRAAVRSGQAARGGVAARARTTR